MFIGLPDPFPYDRTDLVPWVRRGRSETVRPGHHPYVETSRGLVTTPLLEGRNKTYYYGSNNLTDYLNTKCGYDYRNSFNKSVW